MAPVLQAIDRLATGAKQEGGDSYHQTGPLFHLSKFEVIGQHRAVCSRGLTGNIKAFRSQVNHAHSRTVCLGFILTNQHLPQGCPEELIC